MLVSFNPLFWGLQQKTEPNWRNYLSDLNKSGGTQHHKHINCTWLFISNCNNISDILDWTWFLHYFWLQEFIQQQIYKLMNKQNKILTQQIHSLHKNNSIRENGIRLFGMRSLSTWFNWQILSLCHRWLRRIYNTLKYLKWSLFARIMLHLRCLKGFWIRLWMIHQKLTDQANVCYCQKQVFL